MRAIGLLCAVISLTGCFFDQDAPPKGSSAPPSSAQPPTPSGNTTLNFPSGTGGGTGTATCNPPTVTFTEDTAVVEPARPPPAISGGTMAVLADGTVVAADSDRDLVYLVGKDNAVRTLALQTGDEPGRVTEGRPGHAFVALRHAGQVVDVDVASGTIAARHAACTSPRGLAWNAAIQQLAIACASGELALLDFDGGALTHTGVSQPRADLRDVAYLNGGLMLSTFRDVKLVQRMTDGTLLDRPSPGVLAGLDDGKTFVPRVAWRTVATSTGSLIVHQRAQSTAIGTSVVNGGCASTTYGAPMAGGAPGPVTNSAVHTAITRVTGSNVQEVATLREAVLPVDLAVAADEQTMMVASPNGGVFFIQPGQPIQLLLSPTANAQFTAVAFRGDEAIAFSREPAMLYVMKAKVASEVTTVPLSAVSVKSTGHDIFHRATANAIACASCHPEAGEDGHTWKLPEGPRRTPSLRGGLIGTEPFHWSGDQSNITALLADVLAKRMGGFTQSTPRSEAALAWLDHQPKLGAPATLDAAAVLRGKAVFASPAVGCASCHSGELGTNNANANVGTGSMQVPRLVDLAYRAPFFHDGRVATLEKRFEAVGGGDAHGSVSKLTSQQISDLVVYLRSR